MIERHQRLAEAQQNDAAPVVSDFLFEKDKIFAYINLDNEELKLYERYFGMFAAALKPPDLVIYLQATPEVLRDRIAKKKSPAEKQISRAYLEEVVRAYEHFFFRYSSSDLLVINTSEIDFVERNADLQQLLRRLQEPVKGTQYFLPLGAANSALGLALTPLPSVYIPFFTSVACFRGMVFKRVPRGAVVEGLTVIRAGRSLVAIPDY